MKWLRSVTLAVLAVTLGGCYAYAPPPSYRYSYYQPRGCVWIPGHYRRFWGWVPGHWQC